MSPVWFRNSKWLNGTPSLTADDAGLVYGAIVTDRLRTFRHTPGQVKEHLFRLRMSCEMAAVPLDYSQDELSDVIQKLAQKNSKRFDSNHDFAIVIMATPGSVDGRHEPTLIMSTLPLDYDRYGPMFAHGAHLKVATSTRQIPDAVLSPGIKHRSRLNWWIARQEVREVKPSADAVLLDEQGFITETASANVTLVKNGELFSPPFASILLGTGLQTLMALSRSSGRTFREKQLTLEDCRAADEILLTCSSWCLAAVSQFDGHPIPWPGSVYQELTEEWKKQVGMDYVEQIMNTGS